MQEQVTVYGGPMYAGKSTQLIHALGEHNNTIAFKPETDDRYSANEIVSHDGDQIDAHVIDPDNAYNAIMDTVEEEEPDAIGIDEGQFFDYNMAHAAFAVRNNYDVDVYVAGLDTDFRGEPFTPMSELMDTADIAVSLFADCEYEIQGSEKGFGDTADCGDDAAYTQRMIDDEPAPYDAPVIEVGGEELYEARCAEHHEVPK